MKQSRLHSRYQAICFPVLGIVLGVPQAVLAQPNPCGIWEVDGKDDSGINWRATLVLEPKDKDQYPPTKLKGYFEWVGSNNTGGREYVVLATYDYDTWMLQMRSPRSANLWS